jgi:transposase/transposase-like protein
MANRLKMAKIDAVLQLHQRKWSIRRIARELGIHRDSVARQIRLWQQGSKQAGAPIGSEAIIAGAKQATPEGGAHNSNSGAHEEGADQSKQARAPIGSAGLDSGELGSAAVSTSASTAASQHQPSRCEPWRDVIVSKLESGLTAQRIYQDLVSDHGFASKYPSVRRFVRRLEHDQPLPFRRMECAAGEEAQVDFGTGARIQQADGKRRCTHVFRIVLSHSRKGYSEAVYRQTTEEFIRCLENAFGHFGGVPQTLVPDNLKAGVLTPDWFDPVLNPKLRSFAEHYGLAILPTRPRMARHKGKIESGIGYVKKNALKGRIFASLEEQNQHLLAWETTVADVRIHGTIRKQVGKLFDEVERAVLRPLPVERFPCFEEGQRRVHPDGHVEVAKAYYSVPPEYLGHTLWVRWDNRLVHIFNRHMEVIVVHVRRPPGQFSTERAHLAAKKISKVERGTVWLLSQARYIGPESARWAEAMLQARGIEGVRVLQGLLHLAARHPAEDLERACAAALAHISYRLRTIRQLLKHQAQRQEVFDFMKEHPLIRDIGEYSQFVRQALQRQLLHPEGKS